MGNYEGFRVFRAMAHLLEQLGEERFAVLIDSGNTGKVKDFCDGLPGRTIPTEMTVGGVVYLIPHCLVGDKPEINGDTFVVRAEKMPDAVLGEEGGRNLLEHQGDIPAELRRVVIFVFTQWRRPGDPRSVAILYWDGGQWVRRWRWLDSNFRASDRILRRKK